MSPPYREDLAGRSQKLTNRSLRFVCALMDDPSLPRRIVEQTAGALTGVGGNLSETRASMTRKQLAQCHRTALREACESAHWLEALLDAGKGDPAEARWLLAEVREFAAMLSVSVRHLRLPPRNS
jgi:four helix bundle protein